MPDKINTILNPNVIASIIVITVPITEKNAFSAQATGT